MSKKGHTRVQGDRGFKKLGEMLDFSAKVASEHLPGSQVEAALKVRGASRPKEETTGEFLHKNISAAKMRGAFVLARVLLHPTSPNDDVFAVAQFLIGIQDSLDTIAKSAEQINQHGIVIAQT